MACVGEPSVPDPGSIRLDNDGKADGDGSISGPFACPDGARFATNAGDEMFCLFENVTPPTADAQAYCDYLDDSDLIGFAWPLADAPEYACPDGARFSTNGEELGFCLYDLPATPAGTRAYCDYLESDGVIGYEWSLCPAGGRVVGNDAGTQFCLFEQLALPGDAEPYCDYVDLGYVGYYYSLDDNAGYACPAPFIGATNGEGLGFCLLDDLAIPRDLDVKPYCDVYSRYVGFYWPEG